MLAGPDWLEADEGDLHRQDQAHDVEGAVGWGERIETNREVDGERERRREEGGHKERERERERERESK